MNYNELKIYLLRLLNLLKRISNSWRGLNSNNKMKKTYPFDRYSQSEVRQNNLMEK